MASHLPIRALSRFLLLALVGSLASACAVTAADIDTWMGTVRGPGKIVAVLRSERYADELRVHAGLALVRMEPRTAAPGAAEVNGLTELQGSLRSLPPEAAQMIVDGMTPGLLALMRGEGMPAVSDDEPPPALMVRAKDAAYLLLQYASDAQQEQLTDGVVGWFVVDFNGRSLAGNFSAEQCIRALGAPAATRLVDAMTARVPQQALVKIAELIAALGDEPTKLRAGTRLVEIEQEMEGAEFAEWIAERVRSQMRGPDGTGAVDEARVQAAVALNREQFLNDGAFPAMHHLAAVDVVSDRLLAVAVDSAQSEDRRVRAIQAMEGHVREEQVQPLLTLALNGATPARVRDYAFDRIADSRSRAAIPALWPLATSGSEADGGWRVRWRVGSLILALGGGDTATEWFARLPGGASAEYAREELHGYADRLAQMRPDPRAVVTAQLGSSDWWDRAIALYYFERQGTEADLPRIQALSGDAAATRGEHWEEHSTIGRIAQDVVTAVRARMSGGTGGAAAAGATPG